MTDKWGRRFFKAGGAMLVLMGLVHSLSLFQKMVPANDTERQLLDLMTNYRFNLMGSMRSMMEFMRGFSIAFSLASLVTGTIDLLLSRERSGLLKRVAMVNAIWLAALTAVSLHNFSAMPTAFIATAFLLFALAWWKLLAESTS
jgi:hypothetical protein